MIHNLRVTVWCVMLSVLLSSCGFSPREDVGVEPAGAQGHAIQQMRSLRAWLRATKVDFTFRGTLDEAAEALVVEGVPLFLGRPYPGQDYLRSKVDIVARGVTWWTVLEALGRQAGLGALVVRWTGLAGEEGFAFATFARPRVPNTEKRHLLSEGEKAVTRMMYYQRPERLFTELDLELYYGDKLDAMLMLPPLVLVECILQKATDGDEGAKIAATRVLSDLFEVYDGATQLDIEIQPDFAITMQEVEECRRLACGVLSAWVDSGSRALAVAAAGAVEKITRPTED